jgi:hypothetical protein
MTQLQHNEIFSSIFNVECLKCAHKEEVCDFEVT